MRTYLPAGSAPRCHKDLSWAGLAPRAAALSATTEIAFSKPFFTHRRKNLLGRDKRTRLTAAAILFRAARRSWRMEYLWGAKTPCMAPDLQDTG